MPFAAIVQLTSKASVAANLKTCQKLITSAAGEGAKIVFLPEASDFILSPPFPKDQPRPTAASLSKPLDNTNPFLNGLKRAALENGVWVSVGLHETSPDPERCYNTAVLLDPEGTLVQAYRKLHLFDVDIKGGATMLESKTTVPGSELLSPVENTPVGNLGNLICYDLRFPEPSLRLRRLGADSLIYPSAFTLKTGAAHWETLLKARAIETQTWVFAAAQVGCHAPTEESGGSQGLATSVTNATSTTTSTTGSTSAQNGVSTDSTPPPPAPRYSYGGALAIDPWGRVMARLPAWSEKYHEYHDSEGEGLFTLANVDLEWEKLVRKEMPLWEQRRRDIYGEL